MIFCFPELTNEKVSIAMQRHATLLSLFLLVVASAGTHAAPSSPEALGPHPVGVTTIQLSDAARTDEKLQGPRPLLAEIWYPAAASAKGGAPTKFSDFYLGGTDIQMNTILAMAFKFDIAAMDGRFKTIAVRDAELAEGVFPLLVFSHGNGGMRSQSTFWCDHMASHGFIVAAVDHTRNSCATSFEGKVIPYDLEGRTQAAIDRPKDVSFLIDSMEAMNNDSNTKFAGHVDMENIGVAGHSFGGFTAMAVITQDPRVDAIAPMAGVVPEFSTSSSKPLLIFIATEDSTIKEKGNSGARAYFEATEAPKYLVEMKDAGHFSYSDMYQINPAWGDGVGHGKRITSDEEIDFMAMEDVYRLTNGYSVAFFNHFLKGDKTFESYLTTNQAEDALIFRAKP